MSWLFLQVQLDLFAQTAFGADAQAIADDQHADHQLGINRRPSGMTVVRGQVLMQIGQIQKAVDLAQQVVLRHQFIEVERLEKGLLWVIVAAHHGSKLRP